MVEPQADPILEASIERAEAVEQAMLAEQPPGPIEEAENALRDIYFVSGLGADERVFRLLELKGYQPVHIRWLDPEPGESIEHYAQRLTTQIHADRPILVGLSFGGIIAVEIAKQIEVERVILISSAKDRFEVPLYFRLLRWLPIHRIFPFKSLLWLGYWIAYWFFSTESPEERRLLRAILLDTDAHFLKWALHRVVTWRNETIPERLCHIHGLSDRIFPIRFLDPDFTIEQGGHFMIVNRAGQISRLIEKIMA